MMNSSNSLGSEDKLTSADPPAFPPISRVTAGPEGSASEPQGASPQAIRRTGLSNPKDWSLIVNGLEKLEVTRRSVPGGLRSRRSSLGSPFVSQNRLIFKRRVTPDLKSSSSSPYSQGRGGLLRPSRLSKALSQVPNLGKEALLDESKVRVSSAKTLSRRSDPLPKSAFAGGLSKSFSSTSLPSLEDDSHHSSPTGSGMNRTFGLLNLQQPTLSQSVQDFSECCRELETFCISEEQKWTGSSFRDRDRSQRGRGHRRGHHGSGSRLTGRRKDQYSPLNAYDDEEKDESSAGKTRRLRHKSKKEETCQHGTSTVSSCSASSPTSSSSCATQARRQQDYGDVSVDDLAGYLENSIVFPKKMSYMAEMMYT